MKCRVRLLLLVFAALSAGQQISGELKQWHDVTLTFDGPATSESAEPNPFLSYRLNVTFAKGSRSMLFPVITPPMGMQPRPARNPATSGACILFPTRQESGPTPYRFAVALKLPQA